MLTSPAPWPSGTADVIGRSLTPEPERGVSVRIDAYAISNAPVAPPWCVPVGGLHPDGPEGSPLNNVSATMWTWGVMRTPNARSRRWWWSAVGPWGARGGFALSEAVARVRAQRALAYLRGW